MQAVSEGGASRVDFLCGMVSEEATGQKRMSRKSDTGSPCRDLTQTPPVRWSPLFSPDPTGSGTPDHHPRASALAQAVAQGFTTLS